MKKIALFNGNIEMGGITEVIFNLAISLKKEKIDYDIVCLKIDEISLKKLKTHNLNFKVIGSRYKYYNPINLFNIYKTLLNYNTIHVHDFPSQLWIGILSIFFKKKNLILTEHSTKNNRRKYLIFKYIDKLLHSRFNKIVSITKEVEIELKKWYGNLKLNNHIVINNGIDLQKFSEKTIYSKEQFNIKKDEKTLVMVSRIDFDTKDYLTLLKAIKKIKKEKIKLLIIGDGKDFIKLKKIIEELKLKDKVHVLGKRNDVEKILPLCDIGVLSSHFEGFGIAALEMMASGLPIIVSEVDGLRQIVENYGLTYESKNSQDLAKKIEFLLENKNQYMIIKQKCKERSKEYSLEKCFREYLKIYLNYE